MCSISHGPCVPAVRCGRCLRNFRRVRARMTDFVFVRGSGPGRAVVYLPSFSERNGDSKNAPPPQKKPNLFGTPLFQMLQTLGSGTGPACPPAPHALDDVLLAVPELWACWLFSFTRALRLPSGRWAHHRPPPDRTACFRACVCRCIGGTAWVAPSTPTPGLCLAASLTLPLTLNLTKAAANTPPQ